MSNSQKHSNVKLLFTTQDCLLPGSVNGSLSAVPKNYCILCSTADKRENVLCIQSCGVFVEAAALRRRWAFPASNLQHGLNPSWLPLRASFSTDMVDLHFITLSVIKNGDHIGFSCWVYQSMSVFEGKKINGVLLVWESQVTSEETICLHCARSFLLASCLLSRRYLVENFCFPST